jgi:hypothetical protein
LAPVPTAVLGVLIILLAALLAVAGAALAQRLVPVELRKAHTTATGIIYGGLYVLFGVIIGFTSFLVLGEYRDAQQTVQSEADDVEEIYKLAEQLPEPKRDQIQGLVASYARVVVEEGWPLMREGRTSPRAKVLADELRTSVQEFEPTTNREQALYAQELEEVDELAEDRSDRLVDVREGIPPILWIALVGLAIIMMVFSYLVGMENRQLHLLTVGALAAGIALVLLTIAVLDRPFGSDSRVGPEPFELALREMGVNDGK